MIIDWIKRVFGKTQNIDNETKEETTVYQNDDFTEMTNTERFENIANESQNASDLITKDEMNNKCDRVLSEEQIELIRKLKCKAISFSDIDKKNINEIFCMEVVCINGHILKFVPNNIINLDICIAAVKNNINALCHVPNEFIESVMDACEIKDLPKKVIKETEVSTQELMEEYIQGKEKGQACNDYHSHDGGSLYDQFEYISDHQD